jgi:RecA/RadA recombinase
MTPEERLLEEMRQEEIPTGPKPKPPRVGTIHSLTLDQLTADTGQATMVVDDFLPDGQVVSIVGEEGAGKSVIACELAAEMLRGGPVLGQLAVPYDIETVLMIDSEQSAADVKIAMDIVSSMGLTDAGMRWAEDTVGLRFDDPEDAGRMTAEVRALRPDVVFIDTGTSAVSKPTEDGSVTPLFDVLGRWIDQEGVRAVVQLLQPRKRGGGEEGKRRGPRRGDDVFGSRVWKGRSSALMLFDGKRLTWDPRTGWKQRGGFMQQRFGDGSVEVRRRENAPTVIGPPTPQEKIETEVRHREQIMAVITAEPGQWSRSDLLEKRLKVPGPERSDRRALLDSMIAEGAIEVRTEGRERRLWPGV